MLAASAIQGGKRSDGSHRPSSILLGLILSSITSYLSVGAITRIDKAQECSKFSSIGFSFKFLAMHFSLSARYGSEASLRAKSSVGLREG